MLDLDGKVSEYRTEIYRQTRVHKVFQSASIGRDQLAESFRLGICDYMRVLVLAFLHLRKKDELACNIKATYKEKTTVKDRSRF